MPPPTPRINPNSQRLTQEIITKRSDFEVVRVFEENNLLSVSNGNVAQQQKIEIAKREQELRAMKAQNEAKRLQNETRRLENEAREMEFFSKFVP